MPWLKSVLHKLGCAVPVANMHIWCCTELPLTQLVDLDLDFTELMKLYNLEWNHSSTTIILFHVITKGWFLLAHKHKHKHKHNISISKWEHQRHKHKHKQKNEPLICLILFSKKCISISISTRKTNMFVFFILCLCLWASENSIWQISGFVLLMFLLMLTLMSRVFSLVMLMLCLCASENQP